MNAHRHTALGRQVVIVIGLTDTAHNITDLKVSHDEPPSEHLSEHPKDLALGVAFGRALIASRRSRFAVSALTGFDP